MNTIEIQGVRIVYQFVENRFDSNELVLIEFREFNFGGSHELVRTGCYNQLIIRWRHKPQTLVAYTRIYTLGAEPKAGNAGGSSPWTPLFLDAPSCHTLDSLTWLFIVISWFSAPVVFCLFSPVVEITDLKCFDRRELLERIWIPQSIQNESITSW